jgi:uncharacterized protein
MGPIRKAVLLIIGAAGAGWLLDRLHAPLPWMIGPMLLTAGLGLARGGLVTHRFYRPAGQVVVSTAVGLTFTHAAVVELVSHGLLMVLAAVLTIAAGFIAAVALARLARIDGTTAFFASLPGGPVEMANLAESFGVPGGPVAVTQALRIAGIVLIEAPLLLWWQGALGTAPAAAAGAVRPAGLIVLYGLTLGAALLAQRHKVANAFFLGPLIIGAMLTIAGLHVTSIPAPLMSAGQVLLGISLGARFERKMLLGAGRFLLAAAATTGLLLALCYCVAALLALASGTTLAALAVSTAPGSITEMALTARALHADVAMVTCYHLVRIFVIIPLAGVLYCVFRRLTAGIVKFAPDPRETGEATCLADDHTDPKGTRP